MNKTISINLGGMFFHIDEDAYQKLSRYFDAVKRSLSPDGREEIMKDIEGRIAELFHERSQKIIKLTKKPQLHNLLIIAFLQKQKNYTEISKTASSVELLLGLGITLLLTPFGFACFL
jgi:hypothetical protein